MHARDTSRAAHAVQVRLYRAMSDERRAALAFEMSDEARRLSVDGIRARHPGYTDEETRRALIVLLYGESMARKIWPNEIVPAP